MWRVGQLAYYLTVFAWLKLRRDQQASFDLLYRAVEDLGGLYVKLLQFVTLRTDLFPSDQKLRYLCFFDRVPVVPLSINQFLRQELAPDLYTQLQNVESEPFASGTFGQVYKAELNGTPIILKVQRPHARVSLCIDFLLLRVMIVGINLLYYQPSLNLAQLLSEFKVLTYKELDYLAEARHAQHFFQRYQHHLYVVVPQTFLPFCTSRLLVQEYIEGVSVTDVLTQKMQSPTKGYLDLQRSLNTNMQFVLKNIAYEIAMQGIFDTEFYADPHPGNFKILPNNKYAFLDFGIVGVSPKNKRNYYDILSQIIQHAEDLDMHRLSQTFLEWGSEKFYASIQLFDQYFPSPTNLAETVVTKYAQTLESKRESFRASELQEQENLSKLCMDIILAGGSVNVRIPEGILSFLRTIALYKSWTKLLEPDFHHMRQTYQEVLQTVDRTTLINEDKVATKSVHIEEALETILDWAENIAEHDFPLYHRLSQQLGLVAYA